MIKKEFDEWQNNLKKTQLVQWNDLPQMDLYVDQVVSFINDRTVGLNVSPLTKSMINNYVKKGIIMAPVKKKYSAYQVAMLFVVALLKNIYSIDNIKQAVDLMSVDNYPKVLYNRFIELFNARLRGENAPQHSVLTEINEYMMQLVVDTLIHRIMSAQLLKAMSDNEEPVKPTKK